MKSPLTYCEHRPPIDLAPWVACFWQITGTVTCTAPFLHRVLPDGCADLLFDLGAARSPGQASVELVGPMSKSQLVGLHGVIDLLGVRLRPGAIPAFVGIQAGALLDASIPISELPRPFRIDAVELAELAGATTRIARLVRECRARTDLSITPDPIVAHSLNLWTKPNHTAAPRISVLARDLGLSERAFERRFIAQVGLPPVRFRRLARFRAALRMHSRGQRDWATIAAAVGFSDQSHLVRDWREFAGVTPTEWAASQSGRAGFVQDGDIATQ